MCPVQLLSGLFYWPLNQSSISFLNQPVNHFIIFFYDTTLFQCLLYSGTFGGLQWLLASVQVSQFRSQKLLNSILFLFFSSEFPLQAITLSCNWTLLFARNNFVTLSILVILQLHHRVPSCSSLPNESYLLQTVCYVLLLIP